MKLCSPLATALAAALLCTAAGAQSNNCNAAPSISGLGTFPFSNSGASTDGPSACGGFGSDVWWSWTAPSTDTFELSTCDDATYDTTLAVYSGSCGSLSQLACNDDGGGCSGFTSRLTFAGTSGQSYLLRIGGYQGATGSGDLTISVSTGGGPIDRGCDDSSTGADVIVGALTGPSSYGGTGGIGAYAIGTTSCNVGDVDLLWISGTPQHPVIGQNIYRHEGNTFEMLGMSWLKHGFFALQGGLCCDCTPSSMGGDALGVGCSDPYGSGLNGSQSGLGPRWQVNAHTGAFSYPYAGQGASGNVIFKRIQVKNDDLNPAMHPSATIIGEAQYIAADDAAAGNGNNNCSYRFMNVGSASGGGYNLSFTGNTFREDPAIRAWPTLDANVELTDVQIPGDGLFIVGNNATDNGNGTWHYEYAVYNMNSHVSARTFSVPIPAGVVVSNVGFKDVDYHSGEPFSGTDWSSSQSGGNLTWSTQTFTQNSDANAIRWGTMYNFRFDATSPPTSTNATLGLFRPHSTSSAGVAVRAPGDAPGVVATQTVRVGSPANANVLLPGTQRPITGTSWNPRINHGSFYLDAGADVLAINPNNPAAINVPSGLGTVLCNIPGSEFISIVLPGANFSVGIPDDTNLVGLPVCSQGASIGGSQGIVLTNALDLVIGNL